MLALASGLDDVVDYAEEAADFLGLYRVEAPMDQAIDARGHAAPRPAPRSRRSGRSLDGRANGGDAATCAEIERFEDEGDRLLRQGLTALFEGGVDPMAVIRWKDIFERVEDGIDACDRVAHLLRGIVVNWRRA